MVVYQCPCAITSYWDFDAPAPLLVRIGVSQPQPVGVETHVTVEGALRLAYAALIQLEQIPCGHHDHEFEGGIVYYCPWCEWDTLRMEGEERPATPHAPDCPRRLAIDAIVTCLPM